MKVSELIMKLKKCDPDADVGFAYATSDKIYGDEISEVIQLSYFGDEEECTQNYVMLRA